MKWIIQKNVFNEENMNTLSKTLKDFEIRYDVIEYYDLISGEYDLPENEIFFPYGSISFIKEIQKRNLKNSLIWMDLDKLKCSNYYNLLPHGFNHINADGKFLYLKDLSESHFIGDKMFIRPDDNDKCFTGQVVHKNQLNNFLDFVINYEQVDLNRKILIAPVKKINTEYRFIVSIDGVISSNIRKGGINIITSEKNKMLFENVKSAMDFFKEIHPILIIDITQYNNEKYAVMEIGSVNCAGFYEAPVEPIIKYINKIGEKYAKMS